MDVARWAPVGHRFMGHRVEPLIHERLWGNDDPLPAQIVARSVWIGEAGYDAGGSPMAYRDAGPDGAVASVERVERRDGEVVVHLRDEATATATFDAAGRAVRTTYVVDGERGEETYEYDDVGRLVAIDEYELLGATGAGIRNWQTGGRLTVEHDADGPVRIVGPSGVVWERPASDWEAQLGALADEIAEGVKGALATALEEADLSLPVESYGLLLTYFDQQDYAEPLVSVGFERVRRETRDGHDGAISTLYVDNDDLDPFTDEEASEELGRRALRLAAVSQPDDPFRYALGVVARRLSDSDLPGLRKTNDFVVWVAEHDEGLADKIDSIEQHNAPEAVARWREGWGATVVPFIDDGFVREVQ